MAVLIRQLFYHVSIVLLLHFVYPARAQTRCSIQVPVPDLGYCEAVGALEENTEIQVHETRGRISGIQDYQEDTFKLFDDQFTKMVNQTTFSDAEIKDIEEEIATMKRVLAHVQTLQAVPGTSTSTNSSRRGKRAVTSLSPGQQNQLDAANTTFQNALADVLQKLQNISKTLENDEKNSQALHVRLQQELAKNQRALNILEQQLLVVDSTIKATLPRGSSAPAGSSASLQALKDDVMDLVINASVAEQLAQRQLDSLNSSLTKMVADEHTATSGLGSLLQDETNISQALNDLETRTNINTMAEQLTESQVKTFVYNKTNDVADLKAILGQLGQKIGQTGGMVLNATIQLGVLEKDLQTSNNTLNGVKGLVLVSKSVQLNQITDILQLKKKLSDDINVMKYAFGLTTSIP